MIDGAPVTPPAPERERVRRHEALFVLIGGPLAWYLHLNASYAIASDACFNAGQRNLLAPPDYAWGFGIAVLIYAVSLAIAAATILVSLRLLRRSKPEGSHADQIEVSTSRTHFLAMWGLFLGIGFGLTVLVNGLALLLVPACAG